MNYIYIKALAKINAIMRLLLNCAETETPLLEFGREVLPPDAVDTGNPEPDGLPTFG